MSYLEYIREQINEAKDIFVELFVDVLPYILLAIPVFLTLIGGAVLFIDILIGTVILAVALGYVVTCLVIGEIYRYRQWKEKRGIEQKEEKQ